MEFYITKRSANITGILKLSQKLQPEFGSGFSYRQINWYRQFYRTFPIVNALRSQLSWTHYNVFITSNKTTCKPIK